MVEKERQMQVITQKLRIIFKEIQAHSKKVEKEVGLSSAKLWMLSEIAENPGFKVSQLATVLSIHASTCSNMLDKLEDKNLIFRDRSKKDQRSVHLFITDEGKDLLAKAPQPVHGKLSNALAQLSSEQLNNLECNLEALITALHLSDDNKAGFLPIPGE
jgi:DNA-binding MarR family transcriptional regulator